MWINILYTTEKINKYVDSKGIPALSLIIKQILNIPLGESKLDDWAYHCNVRKFDYANGGILVCATNCACFPFDLMEAKVTQLIIRGKVKNFPEVVPFMHNVHYLEFQNTMIPEIPMSVINMKGLKKLCILSDEYSSDWEMGDEEYTHHAIEIKNGYVLEEIKEIGLTHNTLCSTLNILDMTVEFEINENFKKLLISYRLKK